MFDDIELVKLKEISNLLQEYKGYNFHEYAVSSFKRRIIRAVEFFGVGNVNVLIQKIKTDAEFCELLVREITVNTTEMFRDPSFWVTLRDTIIPEISKNTTNTTIRIWHAACSSGEEVYSMAILLTELGIIDRCNIYATDLNDEVILKAINGAYPKRNFETHDSNYIKFGGKRKLSDYYRKLNNDMIKLDPELLKNVTFKKHDLAVESAFSKFDLILCRNVLIYFNVSLQDRVVKLFEESLYTKSYLAVGAQESIAWCASSKHFKTVSAEDKVYQKLV